MGSQRELAYGVQLKDEIMIEIVKPMDAYYFVELVMRAGKGTW